MELTFRLVLIWLGMACVSTATAGTEKLPPGVTCLLEDNAAELLPKLTNPWGDPGEGHVEKEIVFSGDSGVKITIQGAEERALMIVLDGSVHVRLTVPPVGEAVVAELPAQSVFGEVSFFHAAPHCATVFCVESARLLRLQYSKFEHLKSENNRLAFILGVNAAEVLAQRIQHIDASLTERLTQMQDRRIHESWRSFRERVGHPTYLSGGYKV